MLNIVDIWLLIYM